MSFFIHTYTYSLNTSIQNIIISTAETDFSVRYRTFSLVINQWPTFYSRVTIFNQYVGLYMSQMSSYTEFQLPKLCSKPKAIVASHLFVIITYFYTNIIKQ